MYTFHVAIHAAPSDVPQPVPLQVGERVLNALPLQPNEICESLPVSFEQFVAALEQLPRMFVEPDGSFVWVGRDASCGWQVDGQLVDCGRGLAYVELKGGCPRDRFDELLEICGWPTTALVFRLVHEAVFVLESEFRRWTTVE